MEKRRFGRTGLEVSVLGFGAAPIGFQETEQALIHRILHLLLDEGMNLVDTAARYLGSEEAIGRAISDRRDQFVLVTKCGQSIDPDTDGWTAQRLARSIDRSLIRLRTDRLDVVLLHSCDLATLQQGEAIGALVDARQRGKVRFIGYSGDNEAAAYAAEHPEVAVLETTVNLCDQANLKAVLPKARQHDVGVIVKRPIANAAWKDISEQPGVYVDYVQEYTKRMAAMKLTPAQLGMEGDPRTLWPEIALRFALFQPGVHAAIVGTTDPDHARANLAIARKGPLDARVIARLEEAYRRAESAAGAGWAAET